MMFYAKESPGGGGADADSGRGGDEGGAVDGKAAIDIQLVLRFIGANTDVSLVADEDLIGDSNASRAVLGDGNCVGIEFPDFGVAGGVG